MNGRDGNPFLNRPNPRSDLRTVGPADQQVPSGAHLTVGYVPAGLTEAQPGAPLAGPVGLLDQGTTPFTWPALPLENLVHVYQDPVRGSAHYLMGGVDREADHPSEYLRSVESSPDVEHLDLDGRHVELRMLDGESVDANAVFAEDGVLVWFLSLGVERSDLLRFLETLRVDVQR